MFCSKCGTQLSDGIAFCPNCGNSFVSQPQSAEATMSNVAGETASQAAVTPEPQPAPQPIPQYNYQNTNMEVPVKKSKKPLIITLIIVGVIVALIGTLFALAALEVVEIPVISDLVGGGTATSSNDDDDEDEDEKDKKDKKDDKDEESDEDENDSDATENKNVVAEESENPDQGYGRYAETRYSDDDGESEYKYTEDTYGNDYTGGTYGSGYTYEAPSSYSTSNADKVAAYVEANRSSYESSSSNESGVGTLETRGTSIVCGYRYTVEIPAEAKSQLEQLMNSADMTTMFSNYCSQIKAEEPAVSSVIIEYYDMYGSLLYSKEYR